MRNSSRQTNPERASQKILLPLFLLAVILIGGWFLFASTLPSELAELRQNNHLIREEINDLTKLIGRAELISTNGPVPEGSGTEQFKLLHPYREMPAVLGRLEKTLDYYKPLINNVKVGETTYTGEFVSLNLSLQATGDRQSLKTIIRSLEQFENLLILDTLDWVAGEDRLVDLALTFRLIFTD